MEKKEKEKNIVDQNDKTSKAPELFKSFDIAGKEGGLGDYRPRFGRFIVTKFETL